MQRQGKVVINTREVRGRIYFILQESKGIKNIVCKDSGVGGNDCGKHEQRKHNANQKYLTNDNGGPATNAGKKVHSTFLFKCPMLANEVQVSQIVVRDRSLSLVIVSPSPLSRHISSPPCAAYRNAQQLCPERAGCLFSYEYEKSSRCVIFFPRRNLGAVQCVL